MGRPVGLIIGTAREERNISQTALAKQVNVTPSYISMIESGDRMPSGELLLTIFGALGLNAYEVLKTEQPELLTPELEVVLKKSFELTALISSDASPEDKLKAIIETADNEEYLASMKNVLSNEPMPIGPDGWLELSQSDRKLIQRIINRLLKRNDE